MVLKYTSIREFMPNYDPSDIMAAGVYPYDVYNLPYDISLKVWDALGGIIAWLINIFFPGNGFSQSLISPEVIEPVQELKCKYLGNHNPRLHSDEVLVALSVSAASNENAAKALAMLPQLKNCEAHSTVILPAVDDNTFRRLGVNLTCDPGYQSHKLYHK